MSQETVKKICICIFIVFFFLWLYTTANKEEKAMGDQYDKGYSEGYAEGYADALIKYGIEE